MHNISHVFPRQNTVPVFFLSFQYLAKCENLDFHVCGNWNQCCLSPTLDNQHSCFKTRQQLHPHAGPIDQRSPTTLMLNTPYSRWSEWCGNSQEQRMVSFRGCLIWTGEGINQLFTQVYQDIWPWILINWFNPGPEPVFFDPVPSRFDETWDYMGKKEAYIVSHIHTHI